MGSACPIDHVKCRGREAVGNRQPRDQKRPGKFDRQPAIQRPRSLLAVGSIYESLKREAHQNLCMGSACPIDPVCSRHSKCRKAAEAAKRSAIGNPETENAAGNRPRDAQLGNRQPAPRKTRPATGNPETTVRTVSVNHSTNGIVRQPANQPPTSQPANQASQASQAS